MFQRGRVYLAKLPGSDEQKYFVVVSNNARNKALRTALALRVTTSRKPAIPSIVPVPQGETVTGSVLCDDIYELWPEDVVGEAGGFTAATMGLVEQGLKAALSLR